MRFPDLCFLCKRMAFLVVTGFVPHLRLLIQRPSLAMFLLAICIVVPRPADGVIPETGVYYNFMRQGLGYYIEVQGTTLVMTVFSYGRGDGKPLFYYASGEITEAAPRYSTSFDPPIRILNEDAYQFVGPLYTFDKGPCLTCKVENWKTEMHAVVAGMVNLRFADAGMVHADFLMNDGSGLASSVRRQGFGRKGFIFRYDGSIFDPVPTVFPGVDGEWVFSGESLSGDDIWFWNFNFNGSGGPAVYEDNVFDRLLNQMPAMKFMDFGSDATLWCIAYGCALEKDNAIQFYIKFFDMGIDRAVGYVGDRFYEDAEDVYYRSPDLITGVRVTDPIPDAAPPPQE